MRNASEDARWLAVLLANIINPALAILLLYAAAGSSRRGEVSARERGDCKNLRLALFTVIGVALPVVLAECGKRFQVWPGHSGFPSGHETFAASAATCLVILRPRLAIPSLILVSAMAWALVTAGYHDRDDIAGALALGPLAAVGVAMAMGIRSLNRKSAC